MKSLLSFSQHGHVASLLILGIAASTGVAEAVREEDRRYPEPIDVNVPLVSADKSVKYDYDIVFVRTPRKGDEARSLWTEIAHPAQQRLRAFERLVGVELGAVLIERDVAEVGGALDGA